MKFALKKLPWAGQRCWRGIRVDRLEFSVLTLFLYYVSQQSKALKTWVTFLTASCNQISLPYHFKIKNNARLLKTSIFWWIRAHSGLFLVSHVIFNPLKLTFICAATRMKVNPMISVWRTENVLFNQMKICTKILLKEIHPVEKIQPDEKSIDWRCENIR